MERFKRRLDSLHRHHQKCEEPYLKAKSCTDLSHETGLCSHSEFNNDNQPSSSTKQEMLPDEVEPSKSDLSNKMELSSHGISNNDNCPSSGEHDMLLEETEFSSYSGSVDGYLSSSTPSSSDDEVIPEKSESLCHRLLKKDSRHSSCIEHEVLDAEDQENKAKSIELDQQREGRMKLQGKGHEADSTEFWRGVKDRETSHAERRLEVSDDGEQPHLSNRTRPVKKPKNTAEKGHDDDDDDDDGSDDDLGKGHEANSTKVWRGVEDRETSHAERRLEVSDDGEQPHLSNRTRPVKKPKNTAEKGHDDDDDDDDDDDGSVDDLGKGHEANSTKVWRGVEDRETSHAERRLEVSDDGEHLSNRTRSGAEPKNTTKKGHDDDDDSDDDLADGEQPHLSNRRPKAKKMQKTSKKRYNDDSSDDNLDGEEQETARRPPVKLEKKTTARKGQNDDVSKIKVKRRPWSDQERTAVQRSMAEFISVRKVPAKSDCLLCIGNESPLLSTRTWKHVKYFVYNEITRIKRKLEF